MYLSILLVDTSDTGDDRRDDALLLSIVTSKRFTI